MPRAVTLIARSERCPRHIRSISSVMPPATKLAASTACQSTQSNKYSDATPIWDYQYIPGLEEDWQHKHECIRMTYSSDSESVHEGIEIIAEEVRRAFDEN